MKFLDVKPFQETLDQSMCGPASLKIVLAYYGIEATEKELFNICGTTVEHGTDADGLKKAADKYDLSFEVKNFSSFDDIGDWLKRGVPVIVDWFTGGRTDYGYPVYPDGHYSVVFGLDEGFIYLQDPELGNARKIKRDEFLRIWFDFKNEQITTWDELNVRRLVAIYKK